MKLAFHARYSLNHSGDSAWLGLGVGLGLGLGAGRNHSGASACVPSCLKAPAGASSNAIPARAWLGFRVGVRVRVGIGVRVTCACVVRPECEGEVGEDRLEDVRVRIRVRVRVRVRAGARARVRVRARLEDVEAHDRVEHVAECADLVRVRIRVRVRVRVVAHDRVEHVAQRAHLLLGTASPTTRPAHHLEAVDRGEHRLALEREEEAHQCIARRPRQPRPRSAARRRRRRRRASLGVECLVPAREHGMRVTVERDQLLEDVDARDQAAAELREAEARRGVGGVLRAKIHALVEGVVAQGLLRHGAHDRVRLQHARQGGAHQLRHVHTRCRVQARRKEAARVTRHRLHARWHLQVHVSERQVDVRPSQLDAAAVAEQLARREQLLMAAAAPCADSLAEHRRHGWRHGLRRHCTWRDAALSACSARE
eukprot:scaffold5354_cov67-Phaeocystis_antarctica.AAC.7